MPKQIENDLAGFRQQTLQEDLKRKRERALAAFQTPWLLEMEQELHKLTRSLEMSDMNQERRTSMEAYREVLQDKLRQFHENYGTAGCHFALEQRKRSCVTLGLLKKEQRFLVTSLFQVLSNEDDLANLSDWMVTEMEAPPAKNQWMPHLQLQTHFFLTPLPRSQTFNTASPKCQRRATTSDCRKRKGASSRKQSQRIKTFRQTNKIDNHFPSQNYVILCNTTIKRCL